MRLHASFPLLFYCHHKSWLVLWGTYLLLFHGDQLFLFLLGSGYDGRKVGLRVSKVHSGLCFLSSEITVGGILLSGVGRTRKFSLCILISFRWSKLAQQAGYHVADSASVKAPAVLPQDSRLPELFFCFARFFFCFFRLFPIRMLCFLRTE